MKTRIALLTSTALIVTCLALQLVSPEFGCESPMPELLNDGFIAMIRRTLGGGILVVTGLLLMISISCTLFAHKAFVSEPKNNSLK